jgi:hypothetical protein
LAGLALLICSAYRPKYGTPNISHALETADMLCEPPELWKTYHISCIGDCRYAVRSARLIENVSYVMLWKLQKCFVKHPKYGIRIIFDTLETADMLWEAAELWKTYHNSCFGDCRYAL